MKIDQGILNKYATEQCSEAERLMVEKWLDDNSWNSLEGDEEQVKEEVGQSIWSAIIQDSPNERSVWKMYTAVAASLLFFMGFYFFKYKSDDLDAHTFKNESVNQTKVFIENHYDVLLSSNSIASIDLINSKLSFTGDFVIKPKRDFELVLGNSIVVFKEGREYFVSDSPDFGQAVALQKSDLAFLPPNMQIKIRAQFQDI